MAASSRLWKDGCYPIQSGPGLGVAINWDVINRKRIGHHVFE
jgi:hypothetical protein